MCLVGSGLVGGLGATTGVTPSHARNYRVLQPFLNSFGIILAHNLLIPFGMKNIFFSKNFSLNLKIKGKHTEGSKTRKFAFIFFYKKLFIVILQNVCF